MLVGYADHLHVKNARAGIQKLFDLPRVKVFTAADDHILDSPDNVDIAVRIHRGEIARVHPAFGVDCLARPVGLLPVATHDRVATSAEFSGLAALHGLAGQRVDNLYVEVRQHLTDRRYPLFYRGIRHALAAHRARFRHTVSNRDLGQMHVAYHPLHDLDRARRTGHDAGAQAAHIELRKARVIECSDEHGRHPVQRCAFLRLYGLQNGFGVEALGGVNDRRTMGQARQIAHDHAEAVVHRDRDAYSIHVGQLHALTHEKTVVQDVAMTQRSGLGKPRRPAGELDVDGVVRAHATAYALKRCAVCIGKAHQVGETLRAGFVRAVSLVYPPDCLKTRQPGFSQLPQHVQILARAVSDHRHDGLAPHQVERMLQLRGPIGRVDVDEYQPGLCSG